MRIKFPDFLLEIIFCFKLQILLIFAFIFQSFPILQQSIFVTIYFTSFLVKLIRRPYIDFKTNLQSIIREGLILLLSIQFIFYFKLLKLKNEIYIILKESLLFNVITVILNEFIFGIVGAFLYIKDYCQELPIKSFLLSKRIRKNNFKYELLKHRTCRNSFYRFYYYFTFEPSSTEGESYIFIKSSNCKINNL